jgi:thioredoxin 1
MGNTVAITDQNFESEVIQSNVPVLIDFWATWCGPCKTIAPHIDQIAVENNGRLKVGKLDVDQNIEVSTRFGIQGIPTLLLFKGGEVVEKLVGAHPKAAILAKIQPHL